MQTNPSQDDIGREQEFGQILAGIQSVHYVSLLFVNFALMAKNMTMQVNSDQSQAKSKAVQNNYIESHRRYQKN